MKMRNETRLLNREHLFGHSKATNCECDICGEKLLQIGIGWEEGTVEVPLYRCSECKYYEIIVNDNNNAVIKKVTKLY
jgi:hypothetical protein